MSGSTLGPGSQWSFGEGSLSRLYVTGSSPDRRQQAAIAIAGVGRVVSTVLIGTAMAVYIGRVATPFAVSLALTAYHFGMLVFAPIWGAVADITGRRRIVLTGTTAAAGFAVLPLVATQSVTAQIGIRWLFAVFVAGFGSSMLTIVSERGGTDGRGQSVGFYNSAVAAGAIVGRLLVGYLLGVLVPSSLFLLVAVVALATAAVVALVEDPTPDRDRVREITLAAVLSEVRYRLLPAVGDRDHLKTNGLGWLYVGIVLRNMTQKGIGSVLPIFLLAEVGVTEFTMGALLAISPSLRTFFMYLLGRATDSFGRKPLIAAGLVGAGVQAVALAASALPEQLSARIALAGFGFAVHAVTYSALTTGSIAFIGDVASTDRESELMGLRTTARGLGGVLGPLLVGGAATIWNYQTAFVASSVLAFGAALLVTRMLVESQPGSAELSLSTLGRD